MTRTVRFIPLRGTLIVLLLLGAAASGPAVAQIPPDRCLVPAAVRDPILNEFSGELALQHVQLLAANRIRSEAEYTHEFMETSYLRQMATQYGLSQVRVDHFPGGSAWMPEQASLWMTAPEQRKMADLTMVPAALASGSRSAEVEAEVVYVGAGRTSDYEGLDLRGKIVLGNASVGALFATAVGRYGAAGVLGTGSAGVSGDAAGYTIDQIGWQSVRASEEADGFAFVLSLRQFTELRNLIERGTTVRMRVQVNTRQVPSSLNVISAAIPGTDPEAGELLFVAHAFERIATPGANDNCSGVATTLEIGRTLAHLIRTGQLAPPRRTIRFLWVPEISGSRAFMYANPELQDRIVVALNYDMSGQDLHVTDSYLRMKMTPDSRPSFLNDLVENLLRFIDQTEIRTQTGNNGPFNYRLVPYIGASDHVVFLDAGIPAMQVNHWPDNFYHSSADRVEASDPTQSKRTGFLGAAAFYYLANAGPAEARALAWEAAANGDRWIAEVARQSVRLLDVGGDALHERYGATLIKIEGAANRGRGGVESVLRLSDDPTVREVVATLTAGLEKTREGQAARLEAVYRARCVELGIRPQRVTPTARERELDRLVPRRAHPFYSEQYRQASARLSGLLPRGLALPRLASSEIPNMVDGRRSILEIYRAVRAEYGNVTTSNGEWKFAYVITPGTADVDLETVAAYIDAMAEAGMVTITSR
jgi:aminopeptidase YwaD